jgi:anti-sigma factor RsiW
MCVDEAELIKLIAGELPDARRNAVEDHLARCGKCREVHRSLRATWDQLGVWEVAMPSRNLARAVLAIASRDAVRRQWLARSGIAAAIVLAAGLGWMGGRWSWHGSTAASAPPVSTEAMVHHVGLDALGSGLDVFDGVFPDDTQASGPGGQS